MSSKEKAEILWNDILIKNRVLFSDLKLSFQRVKLVDKIIWRVQAGDFETKAKATETCTLLLEKDKNNGNAYLAKAIINIYLLDIKNARLAVNQTKLFDKSEESYEYLNIVEGLTNLMEFKFIDAYKLFS